MPTSLRNRPEMYSAVARLVEEGRTPAEISRATGVTPGTIVRHFPLAGAVVPPGDWVDVPGWPEYAVTSSGLVRANEKVSSSGSLLRPRLLKPSLGWYGHEMVFFTRDAKTVTKHVGRLVLETFVGPPASENLECCHEDGNPTNNHVSNLRWDTHRANMDDMVRHGSRKSSHCKWGHPFEGKNVTHTSRGYQRCVACSREYQRSARAGREFNPALATEEYNRLASGFDRAALAEDRITALDRMVEDEVSVSEIMRTLKMDHRTIRKRHPDYRPFPPGGAGDANEIRKANKVVNEMNSYGDVRRNH